MPSIKKGKTSVGSKTYDTPYTNVGTSGDSGGKGYTSSGLDIVKAVPGRGKKRSVKATKKARRSF